MDPQTGLSRALWLLLFLHLSLLKGCPTLDLSQDDNRSEKEPLACIPEPRRALEPLQHSSEGHSSEEAWKTKEAASAGGLGPGDNILPTPREPQSPKKMPDSSCFGGRRMDRIEFSGLGCKTAKTEAQIPKAAAVLLAEEETGPQCDGGHANDPDQQRTSVGTEEPIIGSPSDGPISCQLPGPL
ncbi:natriuretic peptides B [Artibeus jamaicensis]|uniref:natriuretic peptides B n=1 Tax=Artibeus jamaicensis TaxID=9417 RepID=UPI00235ABDE6|nr:natriuretic peptides B [Artibeus jamaicensis]